MPEKILIILLGLIYDIIAFPVLVLALLVCPFIPRLRTYILDRFRFKGRQLKGCTAIFFCSSIGEFDQVIPLVEKIKSNGYQAGILFHSRNGYNYADRLGYRHITLTPFDSFLFYFCLFAVIRPKITILNRNEAWPGFITAAALFNHVYVTNFIDRKYRFVYSYIILLLFYPVRKVFTSNPNNNFRQKKFIYAGDTKIDRVKQRLKEDMADIARLSETHRVPSKKLLVVGNAYTNDCRILEKLLSDHPSISNTWQFIIIPGRPAQKEELDTIFNSVNIAALNPEIIPSFGNLMHYYAIADYAWIGGGFDAGIHNVIEAMCAGKQMISGPNLYQQPLAIEAAAGGQLKLFRTEKELYACLDEFEVSGNINPWDEVNHTNKIFTNIVEYESSNSR